MKKVVGIIRLLLVCPVVFAFGCAGAKDSASSTSTWMSVSSTSLRVLSSSVSSQKSVSSSSASKISSSRQSLSSASMAASVSGTVSSAPIVLTPNAGVAVKMAESIMLRNPRSFGSWNYETGTVLRGFEELYKATGDERLLTYLKSTVDSAVTATGKVSGFNESEYNIDQVKEGTSVLYLYELTADERYKKAADQLRNQLANHPRTHEGGFWHKNKYPWQMWLDGLYMGEPFYAHYSLLFNEEANFDDVMLQMTLMETHALDPKTGLLYHAWDESGNSSWANPVTHQSPVFWGRSIGWYVMALVDVLDFMPQSRLEQRQILINILQRQVKALTAYQDTDGVWWQVIDRVGDSKNWPESSATAMYVYAIAKGVRKGYLSSEYKALAIKGWNGLNNVFVVENANGTLTLKKTCEGTGVGANYSFYTGRQGLDNDTKGLGPYLMAGAEILNMSVNH